MLAEANALKALRKVKQQGIPLRQGCTQLLQPLKVLQPVQGVCQGFTVLGLSIVAGSLQGCKGLLMLTVRHTSVDGQTDRQIDGQTDRCI